MAATHELLTVAEVADRLRVSTMTVYRLIQREEIQALRIGRSYRIHTDALDAFLQSDVVLSEDARGTVLSEDARGTVLSEDARGTVREDVNEEAN